MEWIRHGERFVYRSSWVDLSLVDVEIPGGPRFDHHVLRTADAAGVLMHDPRRGVLLIWRHRFITDRWGWEIPGGMVDPGEDPADTARREAIEESGWEPGPMRHLTTFNPVSGFNSQAMHCYYAEGATEVGEPELGESSKVEWVPVEELRRILHDGEMLDGLCVVAGLYALAFLL